MYTDSYIFRVWEESTSITVEAEQYKQELKPSLFLTISLPKISNFCKKFYSHGMYRSLLWNQNWCIRNFVKIYILFLLGKNDTRLAIHPSFRNYTRISRRLKLEVKFRNFLVCLNLVYIFSPIVSTYTSRFSYIIHVLTKCGWYERRVKSTWG